MCARACVQGTFLRPTAGFSGRRSSKAKDVSGRGFIKAAGATAYLGAQGAIGASHLTVSHRFDLLDIMALTIMGTGAIMVVGAAKITRAPD